MRLESKLLLPHKDLRKETHCQSWMGFLWQLRMTLISTLILQRVLQRGFTRFMK
nr:hypothetical protein Iba_chr14eCG0560 [Ipomoea batatas]GME08207.1 hypothetical protein Iba_scaffold7373CG0120 [Ipomoea batatas]GME08208.1 hypothetical protein Iba_scaffold7373CG0130 [Ipomoea batatas]